MRPTLAAPAFLVFGAAAIAGISCQEPASDHIEVDGSSCITCHRAEFLRAEDPPHSGLLPMNCGRCHSEEAWSPTTFDHAAAFELTGAHADAECTGCHTQGFEQGQTSHACVDCHRDDYDASALPGHDRFPTTCADCHGTTAWKPASSGAIDHDQFPLQGAHARVMCRSCHTQGYDPGQTPNECVDCHRDDYDASALPGHDRFPTTCADCHGTTAWKPASSGAIDHDQFPLQGAHARVVCASCHTQGYETGQTPTDCVGCHRNDYDASPYPGHDGFPTTCSDCHDTAGWKPARGGHPETAFPIATGDHRGYDCADCHNASLGANGRDNADCVGCHEGKHTRAKMDAEHREESGYPSGAAPPNFCLDCHPKGRKD